MVNDRWTRKIVAFLHDPPDKAFSIPGHKGRARELQQIALGREAEKDEKECAKTADHIASAADRVNLPHDLTVSWNNTNAALTHPLAGTKLELGMMSEISTADTIETAKKVVASLVENIPNNRLRFLRLWRCLFDELANEFSKLGVWFKILPAETRQPDHPLLQHLSITAAIADALPQPALLIFSIGPVEDFIAVARRTQDLWMGSWLLSYLSWMAMKNLAEVYGPDVIVYPSLHGQALCDWWLARDQQVPIQKPSSKDLVFASLPNRFVALLPACEAQEAAEKAAQAIQKGWQELAEHVFSVLANKIMPADTSTQQMWKKQVSRQWEIYWMVLPWAGKDKKDKEQADAVKAQFESVSFLGELSADWEFGRVYQKYSERPWTINWGTVYSLLYDLTDRAFRARKNLRDFRPGEEQGEKCTVCGQRAALRSLQHEARDFWKTVADNLNLHRQGRHEIKPDGQERLCAVCTVKRFVQREVLQDEFGLQGGFPSTSEVAAVRFKERILDKLADARVSEALDHFLRHAEQVPIPRTVAENAVPYLEKKAESQFGRDLLKLDGEYLFTDTWTPKHLREVNPNLTEEEAEAKAQEGRRLLGRLYEAVGTQPKKYYAILFMDGDHMGRWLSGTHRGLAQFGDILHPEVRQALKNDPQWSGILGQKRLMTPAVHAAISGALANFSLKLVRWVIEERHAGRVVYAGGDDVLALLPVDDVLSAARELRALFSGEVKVNGPQNADLRHVSWEVSFGDQTCTGYIVFGGELLLTMGPTATASIGVAIAHHLHPLDLALQAARRAEKAAKETYGRNALAVEVLKRSGEAISVGTQFYLPQDKSTDAVAILQEFCAKLQAEAISAKFPYVLSAEVRTLEALPREAQEAELRRLLKRHAGEKLGREEKEEQAREWAKKLLRLVAILEASHGNEDKAPPKPPGLERLSNWLLVCSFIVRGSEP